MGLCFAAAFSLIGDRGAAGQILLLHGGFVGKFYLSARIQFRDGLGFAVDILMFGNSNIFQCDRAGIGDGIFDLHFLPLMSGGRRDGTIHINSDFRFLTGNRSTNGLTARGGLTIFLVHGVLGKVLNKSLLQFAGIDAVGTGPGLGFSGLQDGRTTIAEIRNDICLRAEKNDRILQILISRIGNGDGHVHFSGTRQVLRRQFDGAGNRISFATGDGNQRHQRKDPHTQYQHSAFHHALSRL